MAASETEVQAQWKAAVNLLEETRLFAEYNSANALGLIDTFVQSLEGDFVDLGTQAVGAFRARYSAVMASDVDLLNFVLLQYARIMATQEKQQQPLIDLLYQRFIDTSQHVRSRGMTLASPASGGSNVGTGSIYRLKTDAYGYTIESGYADAKTAKVTQDAFSGADLHEELIQIEGAYPSRDLLELEIGSGRIGQLKGLTHRNAGTLQNAGFESVSTASAVAVGSPQALTSAPDGWELVSGSIGDIIAQADSVPKSLVGEALPIALRFQGNAKIRQKLSTNRVQLDAATPYLAGVWIKREGNSTGNVKLALESADTGTATQSITQAIGSLTNVTWTFVPIALGTGSWFKNFNAANLALSLEVSSLATSTVSIDGVVFAPGTFFDGSWYWAVGGTTAWKQKNDTFSWTDSETSPAVGKLQRHMKRACGRYLPHVPNATQVTASGGRTLTFANVSSSDTITASSGSFVSDGYQVGMLVTIAGTSNNNMTTGPIVSVTATVLTFGAGTSLVNEGPLSSTATLNATSSVTDP